MDQIESSTATIDATILKVEARQRSESGMLDLANQLVGEAELELETMTALVSTQPLSLSARQTSSLKEARQNVLTSRSKRSDLEKKTEKDLAFIQSQRDKKLSNLLQAKKLESEAEAGAQRD